MTVGDLRKILEGLPDDMPVASFDAGGYLACKFCGAEVVTPDGAMSRMGYRQPDQPYLEIGA